MCLKWKNRGLFLSSSEESMVPFFLFVRQKMAPIPQSAAFSSKLWIRLGFSPAHAFLLSVVSGSVAEAMAAYGSQSLPGPSEDLTWFQSKAISGTIGTCRSVHPLPLSLCLSPSHSYTAALQLLSCWTGLKRSTAAGGVPDVGHEQRNILCCQFPCLAVCKSSLNSFFIIYYVAVNITEH